MIDGAILTLTFIAALGSGLMAGFFFAFSMTVMAALGRLPAAQGIAAMQSINVTVLNPVFFAAFFGTAALCLVLAAASFVWWGQARANFVLAASLMYLVGSIGVTIARNVPLNEALAIADPGAPEAAALWSRYLKVWTVWNHVRTAACLAAAAGFTAALL